MDKEVAGALMDLAVEMDVPIGKMFAVVERIEEGVTKDRFKKAVGDLMGAVFRDIIHPLEKLYPDLNQDKSL